MIRTHKPTKKAVLPSLYGAFDCETEGLHGETRLVCLVLNNGFRKEFTGNEKQTAAEEFVEFVATRSFRGYHLYAHNLAFDLEKTFGSVEGNSIDNKKFTIIMAGTRLIKAVYALSEKNKLTFLDTFNLIPLPLSAIGKDLGFEKLETPAKWLTGDRVTVDAKDIEYCYRDCDVTMKILEHFSEVLKGFGVSLKVTIAANAKAVWKSIAVKDKPVWTHEEKDEVFRQSYYGGRTEVFQRRHTEEKLYYYDVNSMYPAVMYDNPFPDPDKLKYTTDLIKTLKDKEGCAKITVKVPKDLLYPVLPYRTDKLLFPSGEFTGVFNFPEIRLALEKGYEIVKEHWILASPPYKSPFKEYIDYFMALKVEGKEKGLPALTNTAKMFMNSLYGKFGQRVDCEDRYTHDPPGEGVPYQKVGDNTYRLKSVEKERAEETVVGWASYITSYARVLLYSFFPQKGLVYCDTDSIVVDKPLPDSVIHPTKLGMMSLEDTIVESYYAAPKRYAYMNTEGDIVRKIKGIPIKHVEHIPIKLWGHSLGIFYTKPIKMRTAINKGLITFAEERVHKNLSITNAKRVFDKAGLSLPIQV